MKVLKIKERYKGLTIVKTLPKMGRMTLVVDSMFTEDYRIFKDMGFDIFDEVCDKCDEEICMCIKCYTSCNTFGLF